MVRPLRQHSYKQSDLVFQVFDGICLSTRIDPVLQIIVEIFILDGGIGEFYLFIMKCL